MKKFRVPAFAVMFFLTAFALPHSARAYNAAADFSSSSNPNSVWSYGWSTTLGGAFTLDSSNTTAAYGLSGLAGWFSGQGPEGIPSALLNTTASPILLSPFTHFEPGQLTLNMYQTTYSVLRWTAPASGQYSIAAAFSGASAIGASTDVHVQRNGVSVYDSLLFGYATPISYSGTLTLVAGDHIDLAVGYGNNGNDHEDTTNVDATIVAVPEPGTLGLVGMALGCLCGIGLRKKR